VKHGLLDQADADRRENDAATSDSKVLAEYAGKGVNPTKIAEGNNWHGLTDKDLFERMNATFWYDLYYAPFSDELHVNAAAIGPEITALRAGNKLEFGRRTGDPGLVLMASNQAICQALRQLDTQRSWGRQKQIDELFHRTRQEIEAAVGVVSSET
jgi:hypothetical protein